MKSVSLPKLLRFQLSKVVLLGFLIVLMGIGAIPGYVTGYWPWAQPPRVTHIKQIKSLREKGLTLPNWQNLNHQVQQIGGHKWSIQELQGDAQTQVTLLLLPQSDHTDQPEVEWMDINGFKEWETDSERDLPFKVDAKGQQAPANVEARFFRAWTQQQTFAVLQWYAWPKGGSPAPSRWFWADQIAQGQRHRMPWVAVSLLIPIEPLGDIETVRAVALSLGQTIQSTLMTGPLSAVDSVDEQ